jgi:hypothetical protein
MTDPLPIAALGLHGGVCRVCGGAVCANTVPERRAQTVGLVVHHLQRVLKGKRPLDADTIAGLLLPAHRPHLKAALEVLADAGRLQRSPDGVKLLKPPAVPRPKPPPQDGLFDEPPRAKRRLL